ncbi:uncharacterized protein AB9X84_015237 isoform 1-T2 [Acanthopagrus schlegelii]
MMVEVTRRQRSSCPAVTLCCVGVIFIILLITEAGVGGSYINNCEDVPFIPIYLMVFGGGILVFCCRKECSVIIAVFFFFWFIAGSVVIFSSFNNFKEGKLHCDKTLYLFAFVSTIVTYALVFVLCCAYVQEEEESNDVPV